MPEFPAINGGFEFTWPPLPRLLRPWEGRLSSGAQAPHSGLPYGGVPQSGAQVLQSGAEVPHSAAQAPHSAAQVPHIGLRYDGSAHSGLAHSGAHEPLPARGAADSQQALVTLGAGAGVAVVAAAGAGSGAAPVTSPRMLSNAHRRGGVCARGMHMVGVGHISKFQCLFLFDFFLDS